LTQTPTPHVGIAGIFDAGIDKMVAAAWPFAEEASEEAKAPPF
jgi:hypothetical protein